MSQDPRFTEDEVKEIFDRAARSVEARTPISEAGWTLAELQEIGGDVGLPPERVAEAANAIVLRRMALPVRRQLRMPIGVGREILLPRAPTDQEWADMVTDLRRTFAAPGKEWTSGGTRQWSNGHLYATVESTSEGHRLRMGTTKGDATSINLLGVVTMGIGLILGTSFAMAGQPVAEFAGPLILTLGGGGALAANATRLKGWAARREEQMEGIATRVLGRLVSGEGG